MRRPCLLTIAEKSLELSGTDSTLTALCNRTSISRAPHAALAYMKGRCRGLVQPDDQNPGGPDFGAASGYRRRQPADHPRPSVDGTADSERRHCRTAPGGRRRRTRDCPRRDAASTRPAPLGDRLQLAAPAQHRGDRCHYRGATPRHRDGRRIRLHRAPARRLGDRFRRRRQAAHRTRRLTADPARRVHEGAWQRACHQPGSGGQLSGAGEVLHRPDGARQGRQARSCNWPRPRDPSRGPGSEPSHQKQSGAHRRTRCRKDGDRRGPGPAHRRRRCPGVIAGQDRCVSRLGFHGGGRQVPR